MTKQDSATETNTEDPLPINLRTESSGCFVCGPDNPIGLKVVFDIEDGKCIGEFVPKKEHAGFRNITHGGILFSLLDDVMANFLWLQGSSVSLLVLTFDTETNLRLDSWSDLSLGARREKVASLRCAERLCVYLIK